MRRQVDIRMMMQIVVRIIITHNCPRNENRRTDTTACTHDTHIRERMHASHTDNARQQKLSEGDFSFRPPPGGKPRRRSGPTASLVAAAEPRRRRSTHNTLLWHSSVPPAGRIGVFPERERRVGEFRGGGGGNGGDSALDPTWPRAILSHVPFVPLSPPIHDHHLITITPPAPGFVRNHTFNAFGNKPSSFPLLRFRPHHRPNTGHAYTSTLERILPVRG
jgi:hypothetical protein